MTFFLCLQSEVLNILWIYPGTNAFHYLKFIFATFYSVINGKQVYCSKVKWINSDFEILPVLEGRGKRWWKHYIYLEWEWILREVVYFLGWGMEDTAWFRFTSFSSTQVHCRLTLDYCSCQFEWINCFLVLSIEGKVLSFKS